MHKARRLLEGTICLVKKVPLGASATITVEVDRLYISIYPKSERRWFF
jgi:hypothetical protein